MKEAIKTLYKHRKITAAEVAIYVVRKLISAEDYKEITGQDYFE